MKEESKKELRKVLNVLGAVILMIVVWVIASKIIYGNLLEKSIFSLNSYSKEVHDYLKDIDENSNILDIINYNNNYNNPENEHVLKVTKCEILYEEEKDTLRYCLNNNKNVVFTLSTRIEITFSKEGKILSIESHSFTEEKCVRNIKINAGISAGIYGLLIGIVAALIYGLLIGLVAALIEFLFSKISKKKC